MHGVDDSGKVLASVEVEFFRAQKDYSAPVSALALSVADDLEVREGCRPRVTVLSEDGSPARGPLRVGRRCGDATVRVSVRVSDLL